MKTWMRGMSCLLLLCGLSKLAGVLHASQPAAVSFATDIRPILNKHCVGCHGGVKRAADISFIQPATVIPVSQSDTNKVILPGRAAESELMRRVSSTDPGLRMPPPEHGPALSSEQVEKLRAWITQGAQWESHWAFLPPKPQPLPTVKGQEWPKGTLDYFVLARLESAGLDPAPPASRRAWLRRVSFDLTGLPPSVSEIQEFLQDSSPDAWSTVVDRLLASPHFGERWATVWLDLARYADSMGFEKDPHRPVWPWRDWVIRALNSNQPFDQFTIRQIAGDLLEDGSLEDRLGTAFHRNTPTNTEGGTDDEEYRVAAVLDRVNTVFETWQGVTFKCAQCHDHPYEPIEHREYYEASAFFNTTRDWDLREEFPVLQVPLEPSRNREAFALDQHISKLRREEFQQISRLRETTEWVPLKPSGAQADKGTRLVIKDSEVFTEGTVAHYSKFTLETVQASAETGLHAIRLRVSPVDPEKAILIPELGFVVSHFKLSLISGGSTAEDGAEQEVTLANVFVDEAEPIGNPLDILSTNKAGWGALPKMTHPRELVFVPEKPIKLIPGARLRALIRHDAGPGDFPALVMNRFSMEASSSPDWTRLTRSEQFAKTRQAIAAATAKRSAIRSTPVPVLVDQEPAFLRPTTMFVRGNWLDKGAAVQPGVPRLLGLTLSRPDRLGLAHWLVSTNNPLTARVLVNRVWEQMFGLGLVETLEDFGSSGEPPSHPELLDHLAARFQTDLRWNLKDLLREIALSATYQQEAQIIPAKIERDPRNRLLSRGPRNRLSAEMVRDQALFASGLLTINLFGPPVMPPQPEGIWRAAYSSEKWITATNENRFRRAIYTYVRRTAGYPSFQTFDAPSREVCTPRRLRTNTPLQALVTLNDPVYLECAAALAKTMRSHSDELEQRLRHGWERATTTEPKAPDLEALSELYAAALADFKSKPGESLHLADSPELAALTIVASTLLNLDLALTR